MLTRLLSIRIIKLVKIFVCPKVTSIDIQKDTLIKDARD
jgi:hypothetical protein